MRNKSKTKRKVISSKGRQVIVRSVPLPEPDHKKFVRALIEVDIERQRVKDAASVKWYDERHQRRG